MKSSRAAALAALLIAAAATARAQDDDGERPDAIAQLPWREPSPLARLFLQLPFDAPDVASPGARALRFDLLYSNSILHARNRTASVDILQETAQPTFRVRYGLAPRLQVEVAVPFVVDYGGFLDGAIETVEHWFSATNPTRLTLPRNARRYHLSGPDGAGIAENGPAAGLGDVWAALTVAVPVPLEGVLVALRGAVKLPTGRLPFGSEELDVGASLLASWSVRHTTVRLAVDVASPSSPTLPVVHLRTRRYGAVQLGVAHRLGGRFSLLVQGSGHLSPLTGTRVDEIDRSTAYVLAGLAVAVAPSVRLLAGVAENVLGAYRGADITFPFSIQAGF